MTLDEPPPTGVSRRAILSLMEQQELIDRIKKLPQDRVAEVAEFVEFLAQQDRSLSRANLYHALSDYAIEHAGTTADLDPAIETAATNTF